MLTKLLEHHPWSRGGPLRSSFTATSTSGLKVMIGLAIAIVGSIAYTVYEATPLLPPALRALCTFVVFLVGLAGSLTLAYLTRSYAYASQFAKHLKPGSLLVEDGTMWLPTICAVDSVFIHHGATDEEVKVGLTDGTARTFTLDSKADFAQQRDLFAAFRVPAPDVRADVELPGDAAHMVLAWLWDMQITAGGDDVNLDELTSNIVSDMRKDHAIDVDPHAIEDAVGECERMRLLSTSARGLGERRRKHGALTDAGVVHFAAWARDQGVEVFDGAGKKEEIMKVYNWGNIIQDSPGAAANIGSGSATGGSIPDILPLLAQLVSLREELASQANPENRDELLAALDDLDHELEHPAPEESKLKQYARTALGVAGGGVSALLGNAGWDVLEPWLKL